jgi:hypothetical protein
MHRSPEIANLLKWHYYNRSEEGKLSTIVDSPPWQHIDTFIDKEFAKEKRNVRLALSLDGVNPYSMQASSHSTWPVLIVNYNLPLWLVTKKFFITLSLFIFGKESPMGENIDVYLQPLLEESRSCSAVHRHMTDQRTPLSINISCSEESSCGP